MYKSLFCNVQFSFYLIVFALSFNSITQAQNDSLTGAKRIWNTVKYDGISIIKGVGNAYTQPLRWQKNDFISAGSFLAGTGVLYLSDNEAQRYFSKQGENAPGVLQEFGWYFGSPQNFFMVSTGVYGFGLITNNEKVRYTGVLILSSAVATGLFQSITKTAVGRARPSSGNHNTFDFFSKESGYHSFPSGHSILSFSMAHAIAKQFDSFWVKAGIYVAGSIAPISRLWKNAHWISDVGFGMAFSIVVTDGIDNFMKRTKRYEFSKQKQISWRLNMGAGTIGVVGTF
ncbi:phosphatase PAP2 family protein [Winogradskyella litoriviva]|uniref:Phosphatase PAP2 family protein n=1 Tax=Winogradskyella litoriviva TaxID=1220182 RepID=A0ABX2E6A1_9FLAO|nr:phosphatase PAP2 family protein [Winogradskyella litoriviva]NRD23314.1 phosphatase PAP2 family protein [Winogradskyella litoriviva]